MERRHRARHDVPIDWAPDFHFPGWLNPDLCGLIPKMGCVRGRRERGDGTYDGDDGADGGDISHKKSLFRLCLMIGPGRRPLESLPGDLPRAHGQQRLSAIQMGAASGCAGQALSVVAPIGRGSKLSAG